MPILYVRRICAVTAAALTLAVACSAQSTDDIIKRSVAANDKDWQAAPSFTFTERDVDLKGGTKTIRTYQVRMIEGSQYNRLIAINDEPLSPEQQKAEAEKEQQEITHRKNESPSERAKRVAQYRHERAQDHVLMKEMARAFNFRPLGEENIRGRPAYVFAADPKPGYRPPVRDARVLTGMKGKLWVDKAQYHWAKIDAEVIRPVTFYFIAKIGPGTRIVFEEEPVTADLWQPKRLLEQIASSVFWRRRNYTHEETYSNYKREAQ